MVVYSQRRLTLQGNDFAKIVGVPLFDFPVFTAREEEVSFRNETKTQNRILSIDAEKRRKNHERVSSPRRNSVLAPLLERLKGGVERARVGGGKWAVITERWQMDTGEWLVVIGWW